MVGVIGVIQNRPFDLLFCGYAARGMTVASYNVLHFYDPFFLVNTVY